MNGDSIVQPFKRSMDESRDTAVSFRYFTILEADVARTRPQQAADVRSEGAPKAGEPAKETGDSNAVKVTSPAKEVQEAHRHPPGSPDRNAIPPTDETPRRRKVKFDIKVEAVTGEGTSPRVNGESRENEGKSCRPRPCLPATDDIRRDDI